MSYRKNDLKWNVEPCERDEYGCCEHTYADGPHPLWDSRDDSDRLPDHGICWLPHSCDEWVIGGRDEAARLAADLLLFVAECDEKKEMR